MLLKLLLLSLSIRPGVGQSVEPYSKIHSYLNDTYFDDCDITTTTVPTATTTTTTTHLPTTSTSTPFPTTTTSTVRTSTDSSTGSTSPSTIPPETSTSLPPTTMTSAVSSSPSPTTESSTTVTTPSTTGTTSLEISSSPSSTTGQPSSPSTVTTTTTTTTPTTASEPTTSGETSTSTMDSTLSSTLPSSTTTTSSPAPSTNATLGSSSSSTSTSTTVFSSPSTSTTVPPSTSTAPLTSSTPSTPSSSSSSPTVPFSSSTTSTTAGSSSTSTENPTSTPSGIEATTPSSSSTSPTTSPTPPSTTTTTTTSPETTSTPAQGSSPSTAQKKITSTTASTTTSTATTETETTGASSSSTKKASTTEEEESSTVTTTTGSPSTTGGPSTPSQTSQTSTSASPSTFLSSTDPSTASSSSLTSTGAIETTSTTERTLTLPSSSSLSTTGLESSSTATETSTVTVNTSTTMETSSPTFSSSTQLSSTSSTTPEAPVSSSAPSTTRSTSFETSPSEDSAVTVTETSTTASSTSFQETTASSGSPSVDWETTGPATTEREETTGTEALSSTTPKAETTTVMEASSTGASTLTTTTETETTASERSSAAPTALSVKKTPQPGPSPSPTSAEILPTRLTDSISTSTTTGTKYLETTTSETASSSPLTPDQGNGGSGGTISPATTGSATSERVSTESPVETRQKGVETTTPSGRSSEKTTTTATTTTTTESLLADGGRKMTDASTEKSSTASTSARPGETKSIETSSTLPSTQPSSTLVPPATLPTLKSSSSTATMPTTTTETVETTSSTVPTTETPTTTLKAISEKTTVGARTSISSSGVPTSTQKPVTTQKATVAAETTSSPTKTAGPPTTPTQTTTEEQTTASTKQTAGAEESTSEKSQTTIQKLEVTSLPFSTKTPSPTTASKTETSQAASTQPKTTAAPSSTTPLGTSTARPLTRRTTQPPKPTTPKSYGEGCPQRCPEGSLVGTGCCYTIVPLPFRKTWQGSFTYCQRNRTGHLIEEAEIMLDSGILKPWVASMGFQNASVYIGKVPLFQVGSRSYGQFANLSSITSFLASPQTVILLEEVYFTGICKIPQFCGTFNCSMEPLYDSLPGLLPLPMLEDVTPGANVSIQCNSPSITALKLKCDSFGKFFPRPGTPGASCKVSHRFNREKNTTGNKPLRPFCDCNFRGTASCVPVGDEFLCVCKPGWLKNTCWKSPDICWTPIGAPNKCLDRGICFSWTDEFSCSCDYGFGGEICQIVLSNITWFGTPTTTPFLTPGRVMAISMLSVDFLEMFGRALLKYFPSNSRVPQDPLGFVHTWRKFSVGVAGFVGVFYAHPGWFDIGGDCCRMVYVCINGLMLFGHWMVFMESFVVFSVYFGLGRNRWSLAVEQTDPENWFQPQEAQKRWYLTKGFVFYIGAEICAFIQLFLLDRFYSHMIAPHSCIGQIISLENPITIVNLQIMGALACAASGLGILTQLVKLAYPELLAEQRGFYEFNKGRQGVELLDKVVRNNFQQMFQGPVLFAGYFLVVWSQDAVAFSSDQSLVGMAAIPVTICSVLLAACNLIAYSPWIYGHLMKIVLPRAPWLPIWTIYTPNSHGYLSHEEIVNRNEPNVTLPVNEDWPVRPEEDEYVSAERRHQCERRLTRNYLEMRLQGLTKDVCLEMIAERFLLAIPEGDMEGPQWLLILDRWLKTIERLDNIRWNIPRTQAETNDIYFARVMSATMFCEADILRENKDWARMEHLYYLMGHYPLEQNYLPRTWSQCRHVSQHKKLEEEWMVIRYGGDKTCRRWTKKNAAKLSPELFASPEAIQKYRKHAKEPHTELKEFPAARRYLLNDFYDKVFYGMEEGKRRWGVGMREGGVVEITDYMIDRAKDIQREDLRRRITPKTMNAYSRPEWTGEEDLIRMSVPKASVLIGMNRKLKEVVAIPPVILDRMGVPSSLYRW